jgi:hypothetical protein
VDSGPLPWIDAFARQHGLRYEPDADERWLRAWEPYTTLKTPLRYEHALHATGSIGSVSIARAVVANPGASGLESEVATWVAIVQDTRIQAKAAVTNDFGSPFAEPLELVSMPRLPSQDAAFDYVFASFAGSPDELERAMTPSLRKLLLSWRTPLHAETRPGGFVVVPIALTPDPRGLAWMFEAVRFFGEKATRRQA